MQTKNADIVDLRAHRCHFLHSQYLAVLLGPIPFLMNSYGTFASRKSFVLEDDIPLHSWFAQYDDNELGLVGHFEGSSHCRK